MGKTSFQRPSARKLTAKTMLHPKPILDERIAAEDGFEETIIKKLKVQVDSPENIIPASPTQENSNTMPAIDIAKKKLDSMFNRHQNQKKRFQTKILTVAVENYIDIDKLMVQYGGNT
jgi:hypothetical protein